jgi:Skp family chaperone for outer membrane proteins
VMKVITLGTSAPASEAIESPTLIVPSIRFSSKLVSAPKVTKEPEKVLPVVIEGLAEPQRQVPAVVAPTAAPVVAVAPSAPPASNEQAEHNSLFEVDSTLTNLARVAQELTQQKLAMQKREEALEQRQVELQRGLAELEQKRQELTRRMVQEEGAVQLQAQALEGREAQLANAVVMQQQGQRQMDERTRVLEERAIQVEAQELRARQKGETLAALLVQLPGLRQNVHAILFELDQALDGLARNELVQASSEPGAIQL